MLGVSVFRFLGCGRGPPGPEACKVGSLAQSARALVAPPAGVPSVRIRASFLWLTLDCPSR